MSTTHRTVVTVQPAQGTEVGAYDPAVPLPYPWHIDADGRVLRQELWRGHPARLAGFQALARRQQVDLYTEEWLADLGRADLVVSMYPVFIDADGGMWSSTHPVDSVSVHAHPIQTGASA